MKHVFIAHPLKDNLSINLAKVKYIVRSIILDPNQDVIPIAPYLYLTECLNDNNSNERAIGILLCKLHLSNCHELWVYGSHISEGVQGEIETATELQIPIIYK